MSLSSLLIATRDELRSNTLTGFAKEECNCHEDGQPHPDAGRRYICVFPSAWEPGQETIDNGISEEFGITVGITVRHSFAPENRITEEVFLRTNRGMERLARNVMLALHFNYNVITAANQAIQDEVGYDTVDGVQVPRYVNGFYLPLIWSGTTPVPEVKLGEWVWARGDSANLPAALYMEVKFRAASRLQKWEIMH